jgi:hypothetical protein
MLVKKLPPNVRVPLCCATSKALPSLLFVQVVQPELPQVFPTLLHVCRGFEKFLSLCTVLEWPPESSQMANMSKYNMCDYLDL